jgi:hypothetical protein
VTCRPPSYNGTAQFCCHPSYHDGVTNAPGGATHDG